MSFDNRRSTMEGGATGGSSTGDVQSQTSVTLCKTGCGFYANASFEGMCSKCYKEEQLRQQQQQLQQQPSEQLPTEATVAAAAVDMLSSDAAASGSAEAVPNDDVLKLKYPDCMFSPASAEQLAGACAAADAMMEESATNLSEVETGAPTILSTNTSQTSMSDVSSEGGDVDESTGEEKSGSDKKRKNRCHACKKRVGLTGFECRCGGLYCSVHRYSDKHDCNFDYKELGQDLIRKNNPVVVGEKIQKL